MSTDFPALPPQARAWAAGLPEDAKPVLLAAQYPRVVALIAASWVDGRSAGALLDELLAPLAGKGSALELELRRLRDLAIPPSSALAETDWCAHLVVD